jgi:hypoxanthine phosphoribosyltransferase
MAISPQQAHGVLANAERLYDRLQIKAALDTMSNCITRELESSDPIALCVMNGGLIVAGHLLTRLSFPLQLDYVHVTRYHGRTRGGEIHWYKKPVIPLKNRAVLVIDDILDEGHTLAEILSHCRIQGAKRITAAVLVDKRHDRKQRR